MGSVYPRRNKLWIRFKGPDGWTQQKTPYHVGEENKARKVLLDLEASVLRRMAWSGGRGTMRSSGVGWRPIMAGHPESFHSARIAASVGWTGIRRGCFVLVRPLSYEVAMSSRPSGLSDGS